MSSTGVMSSTSTPWLFPTDKTFFGDVFEFQELRRNAKPFYGKLGSDKKEISLGVVPKQKIKAGTKIPCLGYYQLFEDREAVEMLVNQSSEQEVDVFADMWEATPNPQRISTFTSPVPLPKRHTNQVIMLNGSRSNNPSVVSWPPKKYWHDVPKHKTLVGGQGAFIWPHLPTVPLGAMPKMIISSASEAGVDHWQTSDEFASVTKWFRESGNWAWFLMSYGLSNQLGRTAGFHDVDLVYLTALEDIEPGEHIFLLRSKLLLSRTDSDEESKALPRPIFLHEFLHQSILSFSMKFRTVVLAFIRDAEFHGLLEKLVEQFGIYGISFSKEQLRHALLAFDLNPNSNSLEKITQNLLDDIYSIHTATAFRRLLRPDEIEKNRSVQIIKLLKD